ncbi:hypothetical protein AcV7_006150 [Taiwanofungus camphoratus]|nr:hypothetical protein AcV7_006150 [Antrodia cinnamomea]
MHRCLLVAEIVDSIIEYVRAGPPKDHWPIPGYCSAASVVALALTSRSFSEPALNILWRTQSHLANLVRTLPDDALCEEHKEIANWGTKHIYHLARPLVPSDWTRFQTYASRIKRLGYMNFEYAEQELENMVMLCDWPPRFGVDRSILEALRLYHPTRVVLPNLRELRWYTEEMDIAYAPVFLTPNLTSFALVVSRSHVTSVDPALHGQIVSILTSLADMCPSLREFEMNGTEPDEQHRFISEALQVLANTLPSLETFYVHYQTWPKDFTTYLSRMPYLRKVSFGSDYDPFLSNPTGFPPFASLCVLCLTVPEMQSSIQLIQAMQTCRLKAICIQTIVTPSASLVHKFLVLLHDRCSHSTLQIIKFPPGDTMPPEESAIDYGILEPLLSFPNLQVVWFSFRLAMNLDNTAIIKMASAWRSLVTLILGTYWVKTGAGRAPIESEPSTVYLPSGPFQFST